MHPILADLFGGDIYAGFNHEAYRDDYVSGWGGWSPILHELVIEIRPKVIIEVGTWRGESLFHMVRGCLENGIDATLIAVDTWLGSAEHWLTCRDKLMLTYGYPSFYYQFLANVIKHGYQNMVTPMPMPSTVAAEILEKRGIKAELIYIDASHTKRSVMTDLESYWPLLAKGGVIFGHDIDWKPVEEGVQQFCAEHGLVYAQSHRAFWVIKNFQIPVDKIPAEA